LRRSDVATSASGWLGQYHAVAIARDQSVWSWGCNDEGQLGDGTKVDRPHPARIAERAFRFRAATPVFHPAYAAADRELEVQVSSATPGAVVRYRVGEDVPDESDAVVQPGERLRVTRPTSLTARAWKEGLAPSAPASVAYALRPAEPTVSPAGGRHSGPVEVTLACVTPGVELRYTTDGSEPGAGASLYTGPILVDRSLTLRAAAFREGWPPGPTRIVSFQIAAALPAPAAR
jgi:hypothetical protein